MLIDWGGVPYCWSLLSAEVLRWSMEHAIILQLHHPVRADAYRASTRLGRLSYSVQVCPLEEVDILSKLGMLGTSYDHRAHIVRFEALYILNGKSRNER